MSLLDIETIIIAIMENRSFDHMLGYLSLDASLPVDGLHPDQAWQDSYINDYAGQTLQTAPDRSCLCTMLRSPT